MSTAQKRDTIMAKNFELCPTKNIFLGTEIGGQQRSFYVYKSPRDLLKIHIGDAFVLEQFLRSGTVYRLDSKTLATV